LSDDLPTLGFHLPIGHNDATRLPDGQYAPAVQFWHADLSDAGLNVPALHGAAPTLLPGVQYVPAEHTTGGAMPPAHA